MRSLVKDFIKKRREDEEKAEKLFIDSILDCDFMDEEEVCLHFTFNPFNSRDGQVWTFKLNFISGTFTVTYLQRYNFSVSRWNPMVCMTIQMKCYQQCFHILLFIFSNDLDRLQILDIFFVTW